MEFDPADARMEFALMLVGRLDAVEAELASVKGALTSLPRPRAYYFHTRLAAGTTQDALEDAIKLRWPAPAADADGILPFASFCAKLYTQRHPVMRTGSLMAGVLLAGQPGLAPHQARQLLATLPMHQGFTAPCTAVWHAAELDWFAGELQQLTQWVGGWGEDGMSWLPEPWQHETPLDSDQLHAWMETAHPEGLPWVATQDEYTA